MKGRTFSIPVAMALPLLLLLACTAGVSVTHRPSPQGHSATGPAVCATLGSPEAPMYGVALAHVITVDRVLNVSRLLRRPITAVEYYRRFGNPFSTSLTCELAREAIRTIIELNPFHVSLADIADGRYDAYLTSYAKAVAATKLPVMLNFGHEMNGNWFPWGWHHVPPAVYKAAWRHIVTLFRNAGAVNASWVWITSHNGPQSEQPESWYPGGRYVNDIGLDVYLRRPSDTYSLIHRLVLNVRTFAASKPLMLTETAVAPSPRAYRQVVELLHGVRRDHLLGMIWFDQDAMERWSLDANPGAVAAFRNASEERQ